MVSFGLAGYGLNKKKQQSSSSIYKMLPRTLASAGASARALVRGRSAPPPRGAAGAGAGAAALPRRRARSRRRAAAAPVARRRRAAAARHAPQAARGADDTPQTARRPTPSPSPLPPVYARAPARPEPGPAPVKARADAFAPETPRATRRRRAKGLACGADGGNAYLRRGEVIRQPGDGSCLFHSLAYGLRLQNRHGDARQLRRELMDWLSRNPDASIADTPVGDWVKWDSNCSVDDYTARMRGAGWGGGIEMAAFARRFDVDVHVYERDPGGRRDLPYKRVARFEPGDGAPSPGAARARQRPLLRRRPLRRCRRPRRARRARGDAEPRRFDYASSPRLDARGPSLQPKTWHARDGRGDRGRDFAGPRSSRSARAKQAPPRHQFYGSRRPLPYRPTRW
ncbi:hypothetical protein JL720_7663 [Aureococcus anophagefferens]|nr:hypothetical protein JL720_7663 [Aureococcus anophagefferens]